MNKANIITNYYLNPTEKLIFLLGTILDRNNYLVVLTYGSSGRLSDQGIHFSNMLISLTSEFANISNKYTKYFSTDKPLTLAISITLLCFFVLYVLTTAA